MIERDIEIISAGVQLKGTACFPAGEGPFATVLMLHGSGPLDRNENTKGQNLNVFNTIAGHLADAGFASLRYDKRGCAASGGKYLTAGHGDLVDDASNWIDALRQQGFCDLRRIYLLGHSEGTIIAAQLGARRSDLAGLILLCPFIEAMESILRRQAEQLETDIARATGLKGFLIRNLIRISGSPVRMQQKLLTRLNETTGDVTRTGFRRVPAKWLRELIALSPQDIYRRVSCPMLIVGGEKDLQCLPEDVHKIVDAAEVLTTAHILKDLTHILRNTSDEPSILNYPALLANPVEAVLLDLIANWLKGEQKNT